MAAEKIICDTDVLIDFFDHQQPRHQQTKNIIEMEIGMENVLISSVTRMELLTGAANKTELNAIQKNLARFGTILITPEIDLKALELLVKYKLSHGLAFPDALIAATAQETGLKLFTYNLKDFRFIANLNLLQH